MWDLTAQLASGLLCFPEVTVQALGEDEIALNSVLHGKFAVGRPGLAWLACGPQLEVVHTTTGDRFSAYRFSGSGVHPPTVLAARDFNWLKRTGLLVGLEASDCSTLCLYDLGVSRVVKAVLIPGRITAIEPIMSFGGASTTTQHLHQSLRWFFGLVAVVTDVGHVLLVDLCLDDLSYPQSELEASGLDVVDGSPAEIPRIREGVARHGRHLCLQLSAPAGTSASSLHYIARTNQLAVGFSDGYLQLWSMKTLKRECHSQLEGGRVPVYTFTFQEPENDPRNCCYLWALQSNQDYEGDMVSLRLLQLAFGERKCLASGKILYEGLEYCEERYSLDLSGAAFPLRSQASNTRLLGCQTIEKYRHHGDDGASEAASPDTSLSVFSWQAQTYGQDRPSTHVGVFDINRWYHAQMPGSLRPGESLYSCPYLAVWSLDEVVEMIPQCPLLAILVHERSLSRGLAHTFPPPEQFFNPTTYNFDATCLLNTGVVHLSCSGYQKETMGFLKRSAPCLDEAAPEVYSRCLMSGLISTRLADAHPSGLSKDEQLDALLFTAVESSSLGLIRSCIRQCIAEEQQGSAVNLRHVLEWAWSKVVCTKQELDGLCTPLFNGSSNFTDPQTLQRLQQSQSLLGNLRVVFSSLLNEAQEFTQKGLVGLIYKNMVSSLISQYAQVVLWFCRTGLLPEGSGECLLPISRPFYNHPVIKNYYDGRREELQRLSKGKWSSDCLMIDGLVAQLGERVGDLWRRDEGGTGLYPPPTLHALLDVYLLENTEESSKHGVVIYVLLDIMYSLPNSNGMSVESFPSAFAIPLGLVKLVQGLWLLDHQDHESSLELLLHPTTSRSLWAWQHERVLQALMCQGHHNLALRYLHVMSPPMSSARQLKLCLTVLLHSRYMVEAWTLLRQHSNQLNVEEMLKFMYETCQELGQMKELLRLPLGPDEKECLEKFLQTSGGQNRELLLVHYLQQANFIPALQLNQVLKTNSVNERNPKLKERSSTRNSILDQFGKILPRVQRRLATERRKPYHHSSPVLRQACRPQPLSTVTKQSATEKVLTRAAFINNVLTKIGEVWEAKETSLDFSPQKSPRVPGLPQATPQRYPADLPGAFLGTPMATTTRKRTKILDLVVHPSSRSTLEGQALRQTPAKGANSWANFSPTIASPLWPGFVAEAPELSLLQTPQVVKVRGRYSPRARALGARNPVFPDFAPQSILRSSLRPTHIGSRCASLGRSVTPSPHTKESRLTFFREVPPTDIESPTHTSNGIAAGSESEGCGSLTEDAEDQVVVGLVSDRVCVGLEMSHTSTQSDDTSLEFHDAPTPEDWEDEQQQQPLEVRVNLNPTPPMISLLSYCATGEVVLSNGRGSKLEEVAVIAGQSPVLEEKEAMMFRQYPNKGDEEESIVGQSPERGEEEAVVGHSPEEEEKEEEDEVAAVVGHSPEEEEEAVVSHSSEEEESAVVGHSSEKGEEEASVVSYSSKEEEVEEEAVVVGHSPEEEKVDEEAAVVSQRPEEEEMAAVVGHSPEEEVDEEAAVVGHSPEEEEVVDEEAAMIGQSPEEEKVDEEAAVVGQNPGEEEEVDEEAALVGQSTGEEEVDEKAAVVGHSPEEEEVDEEAVVVQSPEEEEEAEVVGHSPEKEEEEEEEENEAAVVGHSPEEEVDEEAAVVVQSPEDVAEAAAVVSHSPGKGKEEEAAMVGHEKGEEEALTAARSPEHHEEETMEHTGLDEFVERHLFGGDLSPPLSLSSMKETSQTQAYSSYSEPLCDAGEKEPLSASTDTPTLTTQTSVTSVSSEATTDPHSVLSLYDSDELSAATSESSSDSAVEEDSGSEVEIVEEVKGNRMQPFQSDMELFLQAPHLLEEQEAAVLSLVSSKVVEEEEKEEEELVILDLEPGDPEGGPSLLCYTELKPSDTLLIPLDLDGEQPLVDGAAYELREMEEEPKPEELYMEAPSSYTLMLESEEVENGLPESLSNSGHLLIMELPQPVDVKELPVKAEWSPQQIESKVICLDSQAIICLDGVDSKTCVDMAPPPVLEHSSFGDSEQVKEMNKGDWTDELPTIESQKEHLEPGAVSVTQKLTSSFVVQLMDEESVNSEQPVINEEQLDIVEQLDPNRTWEAVDAQIKEHNPVIEEEEGFSSSVTMEEERDPECAVIVTACMIQKRKDENEADATVSKLEEAPRSTEEHRVEPEICKENDWPADAITVGEKEKPGKMKEVMSMQVMSTDVIEVAEVTSRSYKGCTEPESYSAGFIVDNAENIKGPTRETRRGTRQRKAVSFPSPINEAETAMESEDGRLKDPEVPSKRITRSFKHERDFPLTPRRSTRRLTKSDPQKEDEVLADNGKTEATKQQVSQKTPPRKGTRRTRNTTRDVEEAIHVTGKSREKSPPEFPEMDIQTSNDTKNNILEILETATADLKGRLDCPSKEPNSLGRITRKSRGITLALEVSHSAPPRQVSVTPRRSGRKTKRTVKKSEEATVAKQLPLMNGVKRSSRKKPWNHLETSEKVEEEKERGPILDTCLGMEAETQVGHQVDDALLERHKREEARKSKGLKSGEEREMEDLTAKVLRPKRRATKAMMVRAPSPSASMTDALGQSVELETCGMHMAAAKVQTRPESRTQKKGMHNPEERHANVSEPDSSSLQETFLYSPPQTRRRMKATSISQTVTSEEMLCMQAEERKRYTEAANPRRKPTTSIRVKAAAAVAMTPAAVKITLISASDSPTVTGGRGKEQVQEEVPRYRRTLRRKRVLDTVFPKPVTRRRVL